MKVRLSTELRRKIEAAAQANSRSLNAEIALRLKNSFENEAEPASLLEAAQSTATDATGQEPMAKLEARLRALETKVQLLENKLKPK